MVVIVNERLRERGVGLLQALTSLDGHQIKYTSKSDFDLLVSGSAIDSVALALLDGYETTSGVISRLSSLQRKFKHCVAIGDVCDDEDWAVLQNSLVVGGGISFGAQSNLLRVVRVKSMKSFPEVINMVIKDMTVAGKFDMQTDFFTRERERIDSPSTSREISKATFDKLGVSSSDAGMMMDCLGTLDNLLFVDWPVFRSMVPVDQGQLKAVYDFFHEK
jgi:hypothetical protein